MRALLDSWQGWKHAQLGVFFFMKEGIFKIKLLSSVYIFCNLLNNAVIIKAL